MKLYNKRVEYDYELKEHLEAGVQLTGAEIKAIRLGHADLTGSFIRITGSEVYLVNAHIYPYKYARIEPGQEKRTRKLLLHKREIVSLKSKMDGGGLTIVPVSIYTRGRLLKVDLALAKGKKKFDKRQTIKQRDINRDIQRELK